jgi:hypothetical protein
MLTNSKIALSVALLLATGSVAMSAPKHFVGHNTAIQQQIPAGTYLSFDSVRSAGPVGKPNDMSPRGYERLERLLKDFQDIGIKEDLGG